MKIIGLSDDVFDSRSWVASWQLFVSLLRNRNHTNQKHAAKRQQHTKRSKQTKHIRKNNHRTTNNTNQEPNQIHQTFSKNVQTTHKHIPKRFPKHPPFWPLLPSTSSPSSPAATEGGSPIESAASSAAGSFGGQAPALLAVFDGVAFQNPYSFLFFF